MNNYNSDSSSPNDELFSLDRNGIESFLRQFPQCQLQSFYDLKILDESPKNDPEIIRKQKLLAHVFPYDFDRIVELQKQGAGVYVAINPTTEGVRDIEHLDGISGLMLDQDVCKEHEKLSPEAIKSRKEILLLQIEKIEERPHYIDETKNGYQIIYLFEKFTAYESPKQANELYKAVVKGMGKVTGTCSEGDNVIRIFRLPYTQHLKNPANPFTVTILEDNSDMPRYQFADFIKKYAESIPKTTSTAPAIKSHPAATTPSNSLLGKSTKISELPLEQVIIDAAAEKGITITFKDQSNGTKTIVENGQETSGFVSKNGKFTHSMSGKPRKGSHTSNVMYYLGCDKSEAQKWLRKTYDLETPFYASEVAKEILQAHDLAQISKVYFSCEDGVWMQIAEESVKQKIIDKMDAEEMPHSSTKINHVLTYVAIYAYDNRGKHLEKVILNQHKGAHNVVFSNGILDLQSSQLTPIMHEDYVITKLPFSYKDRPYNCPRWLQFLDEVFTPDADKNEKITFMQEWIGYTLTADTSQEKALILIGEGSNGKSVLLFVWGELVGIENHMTIDLADIASEQYTAELLGKLLNIGADIKSETQLDTGIFKKLVSGEQVMGKSVYKRPIKFANYARMVFAANDMPYLKEGGEAIRRRLHIVRFNRKFTEKDKDRNLKEKLVAELPDILLWAVEGLKRLKKRGHFLPPESVEKEVDDYLHKSNHVALFLEESCEKTGNSTDRESRTRLYQLYQSFCRDNGYKAYSSRNFYDRLEKSGLQQLKSNDNRYFLGIKLKNDEDKELDPPQPEF